MISGSKTSAVSHGAVGLPLQIHDDRALVTERNLQRVYTSARLTIVPQAYCVDHEERMLKGVTRSRALLTGTTPIFPPRNASSLSTSTFGSTPKTSKSESYNRLRPILDDLPPSIDWAVAYGSGVIHQANASKTGVDSRVDIQAKDH